LPAADGPGVKHLSQETVMSKRFHWLAGFAMLACFTGSVRADDQADIKQSAKTFAQALAKGDADGAKNEMVRTDDTDSMIDAITPIVAGRLKLDKALIAKFGEDGAKKVAGGVGVNQSMADWAHHVDDADVKVDGNSATVLRKQDPNAPAAAQGRDNSLHMKKVDGKWKVDLSAAPNIEKTKQAIPMMQAMGKVMSDTADDVDAGKYKTPVEVSAAMKEKMVAAARAVGRPAARPAK
jgi:hypothetical protein